LVILLFNISTVWGFVNAIGTDASWMDAEVVVNYFKGGRGPMAVAVFNIFDDYAFEGWVFTTDVFPSFDQQSGGAYPITMLFLWVEIVRSVVFLNSRYCEFISLHNFKFLLT
jgi:hypothetical protein